MKREIFFIAKIVYLYFIFYGEYLFILLINLTIIIIYCKKKDKFILFLFKIKNIKCVFYSFEFLKKLYKIVFFHSSSSK